MGEHVLLMTIFTKSIHSNPFPSFPPDFHHPNSKHSEVGEGAYWYNGMCFRFAFPSAILGKARRYAQICYQFNTRINKYTQMQ